MFIISKAHKCRIYRLLMFALLTLFTVCKSFDSSNLFRHFLHNLINYWKLLPKLWFYFDPVQYFSAAGVIHNIAVGLCSACWNRVIIHFMISEGPDIMHSLHPVKLNFIRHFLKHILNHQYSQHSYGLLFVMNPAVSWYDSPKNVDNCLQALTTCGPFLLRIWARIIFS